MKVYDKRVVASGDDGYVSAGLTFVTNSTLRFYTAVPIVFPDGGITFTRFTGVGIEQGQTIRQANIYLTFQTAYSGQMTFRIWGNAANNAVAPTNYAELATLTKTENYVDITFTSSGVGEIVTSANLADIIQEIVDRPAWVSGNAIQFIMTWVSRTSGDTGIFFHSFDSDSSLAPRLVVDVVRLGTDLGRSTDIKIGTTEANLAYVKVEPVVEFLQGSRPERTLGGGKRYQGAPRCRWTYPDIELTGEQFYQLQSLVGDNPSAAVVIRVPTQQINLATYQPTVVNYAAVMHWPEEDKIQRPHYNRWTIDELLFTNLSEP